MSYVTGSLLANLLNKTFAQSVPNTICEYVICEYVFFELPKIYKLVCSRSPLSTIGCPKRKLITTPVKKRNIRHKTAQKQETINCALCDFESASKVKLIKHMKMSHTEQVLGKGNESKKGRHDTDKENANDDCGQKPVVEVVMDEDMSLCVGQYCYSKGA